MGASVRVRAVVYIAAPKPLRAHSARWTCPLTALDHDTGHLDHRRVVRGRSRPLREIRAGLPRPPEHSSGWAVVGQSLQGTRLVRA